MDEKELKEQLQHLATSLYYLSDAVADYLRMERDFEDGLYSRQELEIVAKEKGVWFDENTSDYRIWEGLKSDCRSTLLNINGIIQDKIKVKKG